MRASRPSPGASYPVKFASWPSTMFTPTAVMKPVMTDVATKRSSRPSRAAPATIMTSPVTRARVYSDRSGSGREPRSTSATMIAIAPVDWTAMNVVPVNSVPPTIPNR